MNDLTLPAPTPQTPPPATPLDEITPITLDQIREDALAALGSAGQPAGEATATDSPIASDLIQTIEQEAFSALNDLIARQSAAERPAQAVGNDTAAADHQDRGDTTALPFTEGFLDGKDGAWNVAGNIQFAQNGNVDGKVLTVDYPEGSSNPNETGVDGGMLFSARPDALPAEDVTLSYQFKTDKNFDWTQGGKLGGGLLIGHGDASGHEFSDSAASARVVWHRDGQIQAYVYQMKGTEQKDAYDKLAESGHGESGDHLFDGLKVDTGEWNQVELRVKLNSINGGKPVADGTLSLTVNGKTEHYDKMVWRKDKDTKLSEIMFNTFVGGSWTMPEDASIQFKNFAITENR